MRGDLRGEKDLKMAGDEEVTAKQQEGKDQDNQDEAVSLEKQQEMLLINKMAAGGKLPPKNQSMFLQKKLQQRKFFDSGDYAMNQNKEKKLIHPNTPQPPTVSPVPNPPTVHEESPTIQADEQQPTSLRPPANSLSVSSTSMDAGDSDEEGQLQIPRPDTVPQRKASILHPSVHSKLSPNFIHHDHNDESISAPPQ